MVYGTATAYEDDGAPQCNGVTPAERPKVPMQEKGQY